MSVAPQSKLKQKKEKSVRKILKHRVTEPGWIKYDDWWIGPEQPLTADEAEWWSEAKKWRVRLAHHCPNGNIRSPGPLYINPKGRKGIVVSARCIKCKAKLCQKIKFLLQLHFAPLGKG